MNNLQGIDNSIFFENVAMLIEQARRNVARAVDLTMCVTYFEVGRMIVEQEQEGKMRAEYGKGLIKELADFLTNRYGKGFSETNLRNARKFYTVYLPEIQQSIPAELESQKQQKPSAELQKKIRANQHSKRGTRIRQMTRIFADKKSASSAFKKSAAK